MPLTSSTNEGSQGQAGGFVRSPHSEKVAIGVLVKGGSYLYIYTALFAQTAFPLKGGDSSYRYSW